MSYDVKAKELRGDARSYPLTGVSPAREAGAESSTKAREAARKGHEYSRAFFVEFRVVSWIDFFAAATRAERPSAAEEF